MSEDPYAALGLTKAATAADIKKAYRTPIFTPMMRGRGVTRANSPAGDARRDLHAIAQAMADKPQDLACGFVQG